MEKASHYDTDAADYAVMFIESLCHTKGTWARQPFELIDWQEQIIRDIFGVLKPNGYRQFNTAYIEIPKKQGKSELAAAVALLLTCGDGEERAEVYGCAADRQQASIVFNVAADMVRMCPALSKRVKILDSQKRLIYQPTGSIYQVLSADVGNKHGFNTHGVVFDELHTQPNRKLFDVMTKGSGDARMQPLYFLITTAGNDTKSICYAEGTHEPIIDQATFDKAQERLRMLAQQAANRKKPTRSVFSGLIHCGLCGNTYKRVTYRKKHYWNCTTFQTKGKSECAAKRIPEETLEALTCEVLRTVSFNPDMVRSKITAIRAEKNNVVVFCVDDGSEIVKRWTDRSRAESWTPEMKEKARQRALQARRNKG